MKNTDKEKALQAGCFLMYSFWQPIHSYKLEVIVQRNVFHLQLCLESVFFLRNFC